MIRNTVSTSHLMSRLNSLGFALLSLLLPSCDKFLDIVPAGDVIPESVTEYRATLNSGYSTVPSQILLNMRGLVYDHQMDPWGMNLDAFDLYRSIHTWADTDNNDDRTEAYPYYSYYKSIFHANSIILADPETVKDDDVNEDFNQLLSEAYALRAFDYFSLINLYGPKWSNESKDTPVVPINNTIDTEQVFPKATLETLYAQILNDLTEAEKLSQVARYEEERYRYRLSGEAILSLRARIHLYRSEWKEALTYAQKVLDISDQLTDLGKLNEEGHLPTDYRSVEAIADFTPQTEGEIISYLSIQPPLLALYKDGDLRPAHYFEPFSSSGGTTPDYYVMKKIGTANTSVTFRRSEIYLTVAESAARLGDDNLSKKYLLALLTSRLTPEAYDREAKRIELLSDEELIEEILLQRRLELAGEGHDWLDFKRTTQPELTKEIRGIQYTLPQGDPRYVIILPQEARDNNPLL